MKLNKASDDCFHVIFLDLHFIITDNDIQIKLFDTGEFFNFNTQ